MYHQSDSNGRRYITSRKSDTNMSEQVGRFMDEHFYSKLGENWRRITDFELQKRGVDVIFGDCKIDEKVKVKSGYLNRILEYPSFEMSFVNRCLKRQRGWFIDGGSMTDYYAFIAVYADADDEYGINESTIDHLNALFVNKKEMMRYVSDNNIDIQSDIMELAGETMGDRIDHPGTGIHMKLSAQFSEKPINMVVKRNVLYGLRSTREFDIYGGYIEDTAKNLWR